jgi:serine protease inhibitor
MASSLSVSASSLGWNLIIQLCSNGVPSKGVAVSPLSINFALGMLAGGASPDLRIKLCSKLGIADPEELNAVLSDLLNTFSAGSVGDEGKVLSLANAVFTDTTFSINPNYIKHVAIFQAYVKGDFETLPKGTDEINSWIEENTNGMIKNMLSPGNLEEAHVALVNALAFKGVWKNQFDPRKTKKQYPFKITPESTHPVDMMFLYNSEIWCHYSKTYSAVRLPYNATSDKSRMSFIAYLPHENKTLEEILPVIRDGGILHYSKDKLEFLGFPKLKMSTAEEIFGRLQNLGYPLAGNFPEMGSGPSQVESILHNVVIDLDEKGTEAAAATVVIMKRSRPLRPPPSIIFDRPFAFAIIIDESKLTVFTGVFTPI